MKVKITTDDKSTLPGKLAEVELHFDDGPLAGLKLIGFTIWERRTGSGRNVTFPARTYSISGERRSFALLRPIIDATAPDRIRELILQAYAEWEAAAHRADDPHCSCNDCLAHHEEQVSDNTRSNGPQARRR